MERRLIILSKTSVAEFNRFLDLIPDSFDLHFIPVREGDKLPKTSKGRSWKDDFYRLSETEARKCLEGNGNVGLVARMGLVVLDVDNVKKARELLSPELWDTLTIDTRSGGDHLYFVNGGVKNADVPKVVEVRAEWRYVLVPGSYVDPGDTGGNGLYEVEEDDPPAMVFPDDLPEELRGIEGEGEAQPPVLRDPGEPVKNRHGWTLEKIRREDRKLDGLLSEVNPKGYPSASEADFATCIKLFYWEFSPGQVKDILKEYRTRSKVIDRPGYVDRTVRKARTRVGTTISDKVDADTWRPGSIFDEIETGVCGP